MVHMEPASRRTSRTPAASVTSRGDETAAAAAAVAHRTASALLMYLLAQFVSASGEAPQLTLASIYVIVQFIASRYLLNLSSSNESNTADDVSATTIRQDELFTHATRAQTLVTFLNALVAE